ncbi:TPA: MarC family protein [Candidatus Woesearchaeota archaeon]|nr:MarC family protein [Candidatus Woesearchaeota archaeon]
METILKAFLSLFIIMDAFGVLPVFITVTKNYPAHFKKHCANTAMYVAGIVLLVFLFFGLIILDFFGINFSNFKVAGGLILLILGVKIVLGLQFREEVASKYQLAVVPLATPLITGPGVITTVIILVGEYGYYITLLVSLLNLFITWLILYNADYFYKLLGRQGSDVLSRIMGLLLTALGVQFIRVGFGV